MTDIAYRRKNRPCRMILHLCKTLPVSADCKHFGTSFCEFDCHLSPHPGRCTRYDIAFTCEVKCDLAHNTSPPEISVCENSFGFILPRQERSAYRSCTVCADWMLERSIFFPVASFAIARKLTNASESHSSIFPSWVCIAISLYNTSFYSLILRFSQFFKRTNSPHARILRHLVPETAGRSALRV